MTAGSLEILMFAQLARLNSDMNQAKTVVTGAMDKIEGAVASAKVALAGLGVSVGVGAFAHMIKGAIDAMDKMDELSQRTGVTVEVLSGLELIAKQSGIGLDDVGGVVQKLSKHMLEFVRDGSGKVADSFKTIGITQAQAKAGLDNMDAFLPTFAKKLTESAGGAHQVALAQELMGKSGANALPFIQALAEAGKINAKYTTEQVRAAGEFNDKLDALKDQSSRTGIKIANDLLPSLNGIAKAMLEGYENGGKLESVLRGIQAAAGKTNPDLDKYNREMVGLVDTLMLTEKQTREIETGRRPNIADMFGKTMLEKLNLREREIRERLKIVQQMRDKLEAEENAPGPKRIKPPPTPDPMRKISGDDPLLRDRLAQIAQQGRILKLDLDAYKYYQSEIAKIDEEAARDRQQQIERTGKLLQADAAAMLDYRAQIEKMNADAVKDAKVTSEAVTEFWRSAYESMQRSASDLFFDAMQGKLGNFGDRFKATVDRMVADWLAAQALMEAQSYIKRNFLGGAGSGGFLGPIIGKIGNWIGGEQAPAPVFDAVLGAAANGMDYVPRTGIYKLHQGEAVVTAEENARGRTPIVQNFTINTPDQNGMRLAKRQVMGEFAAAMGG